MNNVHRFTPRPKAPPPRKRLTFARAAWLPWALILVAALVASLLATGQGAAFVAAAAVILLGGWLDGRA